MNSNEEFRRSRSFWIWPYLLVAAAGFVVTFFLIAFPVASYPRFYFFPWWIIFPLFFFGLFFFAFRRCGWGYWQGSRGYYYRSDPTLEVLRERFARGETTRVQYDQMQKDLSEATSP